MKKTILSFALLLLASAGFAQCGKNVGYEVKAENAYTNYNVRYASHPQDAKNYDTKRLRAEFAIENVMVPGTGLIRCSTVSLLVVQCLRQLR